METKWIKAVVNDYGLEMTAKMIAILQSKGSQNLINQIDQKVIDDINLVILEIHMPAYAQYASEGRGPGKFPPLSSIKDWMQQRNIDLAVLYPIARKIATIGTKQSASHFLKEFKVTTEFEKKLLTAYIKDVEETLKDYVNKLNSEK